MKERWNNLEIREKQAVALAGIAIVLFLIYEVIWSPLAHKVESLRHEVIQDQTLLYWMQESDARIQSLNSSLQKHKTKSTVTLLGVVQTEISSSHFAQHVTQMQQGDNNTVHLVLSNVNFDDLVTWLTQIWQQQGLIVVDANITSENTPGMVDIDLTIS